MLVMARPSYMSVASSLLIEKAQAAALAAPSAAGDGIDITTWDVRVGAVTAQSGYIQAVLALTASGAATLTTPKLYGYGPYGVLGAAAWFIIGDLNAGTAISLTATVGFSQIVQFPCVFTRLAIGGTVSANNIGYTATPLAVMGE
jgi:hypothetical protein